MCPLDDVTSEDESAFSCVSFNGTFSLISTMRKRCFNPVWLCNRHGCGFIESVFGENIYHLLHDGQIIQSHMGIAERFHVWH